jgi:predicted transcriptional regulator
LRQSKLEFYQEILCALAKKPATVDEIAYQCNMNCINLKGRLAFLKEHGLLEQNTEDKKRVFALTRRGYSVYQTLSIAKNLEKLQTTAKTMNATLQTLPVASENAKDIFNTRR